MAGLWLVLGGCRTSCPSLAGHRRSGSCGKDGAGRGAEPQMAEGSDSPSYKQGFWMAGLHFGAELVQFVTTRK